MHMLLNGSMDRVLKYFLVTLFIVMLFAPEQIAIFPLVELFNRRNLVCIAYAVSIQQTAAINFISVSDCEISSFRQVIALDKCYVRGKESRGWMENKRSVFQKILVNLR